MSIIRICDFPVEESLLTPGGCVLEIGANSKSMACQMIARGMRHISAEANPYVFLSPGERFVFHNEAVVGEASVKEIELDVMSNPICNRLRNLSFIYSWNEEGKHKERLRVKATTIDDLMKQYGVEQFDLIAMDCEGSEESILLSLTKPVAKQIAVEFHGHCGQSRWRIDDVVRQMSGAGYDLVSDLRYGPEKCMFVRRGPRPPERLDAIVGTRPVEFGRDADFEIRMQLCHKELYRALWCLKSFAFHSGKRPKVFLHSDGSLDEDDCKVLSSHLPGCEVIGRKQADPVVLAWLKKEGKEVCYRARRDLVTYNLIKLFDVFPMSAGKNVLHLDSDIVFFKRPERMLSLMAEGKRFFADDLTLESLSVPRPVLEGLVLMRVMQNVNVGILFYPDLSFYDLGLIEAVIEASMKYVAEIRIAEQTAYNAMLTKAGAERLGNRYTMSDQFSSDSVSHHFCSMLNSEEGYTKALSEMEALLRAMT